MFKTTFMAHGKEIYGRMFTLLFSILQNNTVKSVNLPLSPQKAIFIQYEVNMHQHGFEMTWEWVNHDRNFILKTQRHHRSLRWKVKVTSDLPLQAEERMEKDQQERLRREGEELAEVRYMVTSNLLTERPEAAKRKSESSAEGPRVLTDRWKGMTPQQISEIHRKREEQCLEKEVRILHWHVHAYIVIIKVIILYRFPISPETERDGAAERCGLGLPSDRAGQTAAERGE